MKIANIEVPLEKDSESGSTNKSGNLDRSFNGNLIGVHNGNYRNFSSSTSYIGKELGFFLYDFFNGNGDLWVVGSDWSEKGVLLNYISNGFVEIQARSLTVWTNLGETYTISPPSFYLNGAEISKPSFVEYTEQTAGNFIFTLDISDIDYIFKFDYETPLFINECWTGYILKTYPQCEVESEYFGVKTYDIIVDQASLTPDGEGLIFDLDFEVIK